MIVVVIGVSGSGKSTIGTMLARALQCQFLEGDALHPQHNVDKMRAGTPLTDADRAPWLAALHARIVDFWRRGEDLVVACSALKHAYRETLEQGVRVEWVYLKGASQLIRSRMENRRGHFMKADMLASQFAALEEPGDDAIVADVSQTPEAIVTQVVAVLFRRDAREAAARRIARSAAKGHEDRG